MEYDRGIGYDDNDSFIDNTEAVSNLIVIVIFICTVGDFYYLIALIYCTI